MPRRVPYLEMLGVTNSGKSSAEGSTHARIWYGAGVPRMERSGILDMREGERRRVWCVRGQV